MAKILIWSEAVNLVIAWPYECHAFGTSGRDAGTTGFLHQLPAVLRLERRWNSCSEIFAGRSATGKANTPRPLSASRSWRRSLTNLVASPRPAKQTLWPQVGEVGPRSSLERFVRSPRGWNDSPETRRAARSCRSTVGATIPTCPSRKSSSRCRKNR